MNQMITIIESENLEFLRNQPREQYDLIYIDPPFNTGKKQSRNRIKTVRDEHGDRVGFGGSTYKTESSESPDGYDDSFNDFLGFLEPRLTEASRILSTNGSIFLHLDYRESHYAKILMDQIFGEDCFINEIIWAYDFGGRGKDKWATKHNSIFWYAKNPNNYTFNEEESAKIPFVAPGLNVGDEPLGDVWWQTIVGTNSKEKTGYPTQKPITLIERIVKVHSRPGDLLLDFFAGSGTLGEAAIRNGRRCVLVDQNPTAIAVMKKRLELL